MWTFTLLWDFFFSNPCTNAFANSATFIDQVNKLQRYAVSWVGWLLYIPVDPIVLGHKPDKWILFMIQKERQTAEIYAVMLSLVLYSHLSKNLWN